MESFETEEGAATDSGGKYPQAEAQRETIFVIGLGMVGVAFIEKLLNLDEAKRYRIVTCGEELHLAYNRAALTDYFQHRSVEKLYLNQSSWYAQDPTRLLVHTAEQVTTLDPAARHITTNTGRVVPFDHCVLATGSLPSAAPASVRTPGVFVYRNVADLEGILEYAAREGVAGGNVVVVGGGLLGLEAAKAIADLDTITSVTIVTRAPFPLSRQLDPAGGEIVLRRLQALQGVHVLTGTGVLGVTTSEGDGALTALVLTRTNSSTDNNPNNDHDSTHIPARLAIFATGTTPRDDLARLAGVNCHPNGGVIVDDLLHTSAPGVYALGECARWRGRTFGLVGPGVEMADILAFNLTQVNTSVGGFMPRTMNMPDLSTKLKLAGVEVASFGDYFADRHDPNTSATPSAVELISRRHQDQIKTGTVWEVQGSEGEEGSPRKLSSSMGKNASKRHRESREDGPVECVTYRDPFARVYKKYIFSADGRYLLGGMMVGDTSDYVRLVALAKKKKAIEVPPSEFIVGTRVGAEEDGGAGLDDDMQICSCHNVTKERITACVRDGADTLAAVKARTRAMAGCGGCVPLVTSIFKAEMKKAGNAVSNNLCPHFAMTRQELFTVIKIRKLRTFGAVMQSAGVTTDAVGCELCKPAIGSILSSLYNEHVMDPAHHANQDTNDRYLANIQRNGTFSVIPRVAGGEITPEKLIVLGQVAKKYNLYTKITGGQRIDLFGAQKGDLPDIWEELIAVGFESGHAYGKALRTVKSCVGTSWCRYGIGDSVGMAIFLEERYKGIRSPHKFKGGVSGCVRECAEAQSKDFGLIATDKGWNVFLAGNGGTNPRHATLFAVDVPPSQVVRIIDRFIMYYIRTADKLMRTARWVEQFEGGMERLKKILLSDELGICAELEEEMAALVGSFTDEWTAVVKDPARRLQFRQFVNTDERRPQTEQIIERGQTRPADWPKELPPLQLRTSSIVTPKAQWQWHRLATVSDLGPSDAGSTSVAVKYGDSQLAIFHVPKRGYYATQQMCPHKRAFVLDHGIVGDDPAGNLYISCPLHKRNFRLTDGECLNDGEYAVMAFDVKQDENDGAGLLVLLPEKDELDAILGTERWMVRRGMEGAPGCVKNDSTGEAGAACGATEGSCSAGNPHLDW